MLTGWFLQNCKRILCSLLPTFTSILLTEGLHGTWGEGTSSLTKQSHLLLRALMGCCFPNATVSNERGKDYLDSPSPLPSEYLTAPISALIIMKSSNIFSYSSEEVGEDCQVTDWHAYASSPRRTCQHSDTRESGWLPGFLLLQSKGYILYSPSEGQFYILKIDLKSNVGTGIFHVTFFKMNIHSDQMVLAVYWVLILFCLWEM